MTRMSEIWKNPLAAAPDHTPETCLAALIEESYTHGAVTTHPASACSDPPPTLAELLAQSHQSHLTSNPQQ